MTSALAGVRAILDKHLGRPPARIDVDGRSLTPLEYLDELGLVPDDYVAFISFLYLPFHTRGEFRVPPPRFGIPPRSPMDMNG